MSGMMLTKLEGMGLKPSTTRVLIALYNAHRKGLTAVQLASPRIGGLDYRKRVSELRKVNWIVTADTIPGKPYRRYRLVGRTA